MAKKVIYQVARHKIQMIEVQNEQEEQAVKLANRDFERTEKRNQREREKTCSYDKLVEEKGFDIPDDSPSIEDVIIENEREEKIKKLVRMALKTLTEKQRVVLIKVKLQEKSYRKVAEEMGVDFTTIRDIYKAAEKKFKTFFEKLEKIPPQNNV